MPCEDFLRTAIECCLPSDPVHAWWAHQASGVLGESGYSNPVDGQAEGLGRDEGLGCVVLRRMDDAERDGQQVVATLVNATAGAAGPVEGACALHAD